MNDLIKMNDVNGVQTVNARDLHEQLKVTTPFNKWIKRRIESYGFIKGDDYLVVDKSVQLDNQTVTTKGQQKVEYHLTFDMAKELGMIERTDVGRKIRKYFIAVEKKYIESQSKLLEESNQSNKSLETACIQRDGVILFMNNTMAPIKPKGTLSEVNGKEREYLVHSYFRSDKGHLVDGEQLDMFKRGE